jgi:hypothetical protein
MTLRAVPAALTRYHRVIDLRKLGTCSYCIGLAARLSLLSWAGYIVSKSYFAVRPVEIAFLVLALGSSALLLSHGLAYIVLLVRSNRKPV